MSSRPHRRVLFLDTAPTVGGSVISLYELIRGLDRRDYAPFVVTYAPHAYVDRFRAVGAKVISWRFCGAPDHRPGWVHRTRAATPARRLQQSAAGSALYHGLGFGLFFKRRVWPRARALQRIIEEQRIDLVHTNIRVGHDREGILAACMARIPCVCHVRDFERLNWFDCKLANSAARFIYISKAVQRSHVAAGAPCTKGRVVYNGLDLEAFDVGLDAQAGRNSFLLKPDELAVGIVGRLESWKGHDVFLRAMALVKAAVPRVRGIIVGGPVPHEPDYRASLIALQKHLNLTEQVTFFDYRSDVPAMMSALDVLVLASTSPEPFGRVLIEGMAASKPVVATDAGAVPEIIEDGEQGLIVAPGDPGALAGAVIRLLSDRDLSDSMGRKGRLRVQERFQVQQYVEGVQAIYRELLD
jgi:glycosyltransferase involved in cell wall biosynthesis